MTFLQFAHVRMPSLAGILTVSAILTALPRGMVGNTTKILAPGVTVKFNTCTGPAGLSAVQPTWFVNGKIAETEGDCYESILITAEGLDYTATLTINGNHTCDTFNVYCRIYRESQFLYIHNTTLTFQGHLPSPENVHINFNSSTIEWKPPYSSMSNDTFSVDPNVTHYTVYITDNYTGNIVTENVTEKYLSFNTSDDDSCPMYEVSAWNSGGEGELSDPVWDSTPQVPHRIAAENITVAYTGNVLHFHIDVDVVCTSRIPKFFFITLMTSAGSVFNELNMPHDPGEAVANFTITLPQSVDVCSLHVRISAGNSAGMSAPSEAVEIGCSDSSTSSPPTISTETSRPEDLTVLIVVAVAGGVVIAALTVLILYVMYRKCRKRNSKANTSGQRDNSYSQSPSLGGPVSLYKPPVTEVPYVASEQTASRPVARDPEHTAVQIQTSDSTPSTLQTGSSTESGHSSDLLLPPSRPAPVGGSRLVCAQLNMKQTQVQPPASDDPVQYAQIEHHES